MQDVPSATPGWRRRERTTPRVGPPRACVRHRHEHRLAAVSLDRRIPLGELIVIDLHNIRTISRSNRCTPLAPTRAHRTLRQSPFSTCSVPAPMRSVTRTSMCILDPARTGGTAKGPVRQPPQARWWRTGSCDSDGGPARHGLRATRWASGRAPLDSRLRRVSAVVELVAP